MLALQPLNCIIGLIYWVSWNYVGYTLFSESHPHFVILNTFQRVTGRGLERVCFLHSLLFFSYDDLFV